MVKPSKWAARILAALVGMGILYKIISSTLSDSLAPIKGCGLSDKTKQKSFV